MTDLTNRHPVDQLALIRAQIKELKKHEDALKSQVSGMMGDEDALGGDEFIAVQKLSSRKGSIDAAKMEADGINVDAYRKPDIAVVTLNVELRASQAA